MMAVLLAEFQGGARYHMVYVLRCLLFLPHFTEPRGFSHRGAILIGFFNSNGLLKFSLSVNHDIVAIFAIPHI